MSRDAKGRVCAGLYFPVSNGGGDSQLTLFYDGPNDSSVKVKQKFSTFRDEEKVNWKFFRKIFGSFCKNNIFYSFSDTRCYYGPFGTLGTSVSDGNERFTFATEIIVRGHL